MRSRHSPRLRSLGIGAAIAVGASLGALAPAAMAAPPNDAFAAATPLSGPLPIEVSESNAGATAEEGELISVTGFASHHSVWWKWEAPRSEVVSIGSCGSDFPTKIGVFTGESLPAPRIFAGTGPECDAQTTFAAVAGTTYDIGVDGYSFSIPGGPAPPPGEGTVVLKIATPPPPPNDAFAAAIPMQQIIWELPNGDRTMLGSAGGYNWNATSEPGEPVHAGVGGGASTWYRFVAPGTGRVGLSVSADQSSHPVLAVYAGSAVSALTPIVATTTPERPVSFDAVAGQEFRIAVDGLPDAEGAPWMGDFNLVASEQLPPGTSNASGAPELQTSTVKPRPAAVATPAAPTPPQVMGRSIDPRSRTATFRFASATDGARFRCSLDQAPFRACASPLHLRHLGAGAHRLGIEAVLGHGRVSAPAVVHFTLGRRHPRHHRAG